MTAGIDGLGRRPRRVGLEAVNGTATRPASIRARTVLRWVRKSAAASSCRPRLAGWSEVLSVSMLNTTKPCEASRGASHIVASDCAALIDRSTLTAPPARS